MELIDLPEFGPDRYQQIVDGESDPFGTDYLSIVWRDKSRSRRDNGRGTPHRSCGMGLGPGAGSDGSDPQRIGIRGSDGSPRLPWPRCRSELGLRRNGKMRELDESIAILFCRPVRLAFYERLGWLSVGGTVTADQPDGLLVMPLETCWTPLVTGAQLPEKDLHIEGLPF